MPKTIYRTVVFAPLVGGVLTVLLPIIFSLFFGTRTDSQESINFIDFMPAFFLWWVMLSYFLGVIPAIVGALVLYELKFNMEQSSLRIGVYWFLPHACVLLVLSATKQESVSFSQHFGLWPLILSVSVMTAWACIYIDRNTKKE